jgi:phospholipase C
MGTEHVPHPALRPALQAAGRLNQRFAVRQRGAGPVDDLRAQVRDNLPKIEHIVVLMMENHSFDNYLGMLGPERGGFPDVVGGLPTATNPGADGAVVPLVHWHDTAQLPHLPTQSWRGSHLQFGGGANDGFVRCLEELPGVSPEQANVGMRYWTDAELPFYYSLASTFPLATRWFSSCLGPTYPNRRFLISGTAHRLMDDVPVSMLDHAENGTIFGRLTALGLDEMSWANYHVTPTPRLFLSRLAGLPGVRLGRLAHLLGALVNPAMKYVKGNLAFTGNVYPTGALRLFCNVRSIERFHKDAQAGTLPFLSVVDPDFEQTSEENPQNIKDGERFAAQVIKAVIESPCWDKTVLFWVYDEHGGYYDHVPPEPATPPGDGDARSLLEAGPVVRLLLRLLRVLPKLTQVDDWPDRAYDRFGFRVPAVVVSPYARPGFVDDTVYDHTSILRLIQHKWNLPPLTDREAAAALPLAGLDLDADPAFPRDKALAALAWPPGV